MKFPVRFVTVTICLTFIVCATIRAIAPIVLRTVELDILNYHAPYNRLPMPTPIPRV